MADLDGTETHENLLDAFARASQIGRRYVWFSQQADIEGHPDIAAMFRSVAEAEAGHAHGHLDYLADVGDPLTGEAIGDSIDNLAAAVSAERAEHAQRLPTFAATARAEGFDEIADWFESIAAADGGHEQRFAARLDELRGTS